jgi:hypothetical protein
MLVYLLTDFRNPIRVVTDLELRERLATVARKRTPSIGRHAPYRRRTIVVVAVTEAGAPCGAIPEDPDAWPSVAPSDLTAGRDCGAF